MFNNEKQFDNPKFRDFCAKLGIKNYYSSPAHPPSYGQAEGIIRALKIALKTKFEDLKGKWVEYLLEILWAYRTTRKSAIQETPFASGLWHRSSRSSRGRLKSRRIEIAST